MSDCGTALGAAMYVAKSHGECIRNPLKHVQFGPGFSSGEIYTLLKSFKVPFEKISDPGGKAARLLEAGRIVGWFQGRMEFSSRALGGRSILASPVFRESRIR